MSSFESQRERERESHTERENESGECGHRARGGMLCSECDNGFACRMCLMAVEASECPVAEAVLRGCRHVQLGDMCEADGACATSDLLNNCLIAPQRGEIFGDVYVRVGCESDDLPELTWLLFLMFTAMLFGSMCRNWLQQRRVTTSLASADSAAPAIEMDGVPCGVPIMVPVAEAMLPSGPPQAELVAPAARSGLDNVVPDAGESGSYRAPVAAAVPEAVAASVPTTFVGSSPPPEQTDSFPASRDGGVAPS